MVKYFVSIAFYLEKKAAESLSIKLSVLPVNGFEEKQGFDGAIAVHRSGSSSVKMFSTLRFQVPVLAKFPGKQRFSAAIALHRSGSKAFGSFSFLG